MHLLHKVTAERPNRDEWSLPKRMQVPLLATPHLSRSSASCGCFVPRQQKKKPCFVIALPF